MSILPNGGYERNFSTTCPYCGSNKIKIIENKSILLSIFEPVLNAFIEPSHNRVCENCHRSWYYGKTIVK